MRVVRGIMKDLDIDDKSLTARQALSAISGAKNRGTSPAAYANQGDYENDRTRRIARIYKLYEERLKKSNALDFDDLLITSGRVASARPATCASIITIVSAT